MKFQELVTKVETLSTQEIEELVNQGIEIENIQYMLLHNENGFKEKLFFNEKLKQVILKEINAYIFELFQELAANPKFELTENIKTISQNYLKDYFKDAIDLEITNDRGRNIFDLIRKLRDTNNFFKEQYNDNKVWGNYCQIIEKMVQRDVDTMSKEEILQINKSLGMFFRNIIKGYDLPEAEFALKIAQRKDVDITQVIGLDYYNDQYTIAKKNPNIRIIREDEVFSVLLDYDIELKSRGIDGKSQYKYYSPINEMNKSIEDGKFGENKILSKKEIAYALKMLQNPNLLDDKIGIELCKILEKNDIKIELGKRELKFLLENKELLETIGEALPSFQQKILEEVENDIISTLEDIINKNRAITSEEMDKHSKYLKDFYQISIDKNGNTSRMLKMFCLVNDLETLGTSYNLIELTNLEDTTNFFKKKSKENNTFMKYFDHVMKIVDELQSDREMTEQEYEKYDEILYKLGYRCNIKSDNNVKSIVALEKRSKEMNKKSIAIEERIEIYIDEFIKKQETPKQDEFYEAILEYYGRQLENSAIDINQNAAISHLIRAAQIGRLPENLSTSILEKLEERKNKSQFVEVNSAENFEQYMRYVAETRLQQGKMPRECSEFIIKQAILQEQDMTKYNGMIERALEDICEYELEEFNIDKYTIKVLNQPMVGKDNNGLHNSAAKSIKLSRESLQKFGITKLLETFLHEMTHAIQSENIKKGQLNKDTYKMLKEQILRKQDNKFYDDNYKYMYNEIDARTSGYVKRNKLLKKMGLTDAQIAEVVAKKFKEKIVEEEQARQKGKIKTFGKYKKDVNLIFFELLEQKPELLEQYPELNIEFEKDGENIQRKSLAKILRSYEQLISQIDDKKELARTSSLYGDILLDGIPIPEEKIQEELEELIGLESDNSIVKGYKEKLLMTKFSRQQVLAATVKSFYQKKNALQRQEVQHTLKQVVKEKQNTMQQESEMGDNERDG